MPAQLALPALRHLGAACAALLSLAVLPVAAVAADRLVLTASPSVAVTVGTSFTLSVAAFTGTEPDSAFALSAGSVALTPSTPILSYAVTGALSLAVRVLSAVDNTTLTLSVTAQGASGSLLLTVAVEAVSLALSGVPTAVPGATYTLSIAAVDDYGNVDVDWMPGPQLDLTVLTGRTTAAWQRLPGRAAIAVQLRQVLLDGAFVALRLDDELGVGGRLSGLREPLVDVRADRLLVALLDGSVTPGVDPGLSIEGRDAFGNRDADYLLADNSTPTLSVTASAGALTFTTPVLSVAPSLSAYQLRVLEAMDGALLRFAVDDGRGLSGQTTATVTVVASQLRISGLPPLIGIGSTFTLAVRGFGRAGNEDLDYGLSSAFSLSAAGLTLDSVRMGARQLGVAVSSQSGLSTGQAITLSLRDGAASGEATTTLTVGAVRITLSVPDQPVAPTSSFELTVAAFDSLGNLVPGFALSAAVSVSALGAPRLVYERDGAVLSLRLREAVDKAQLSLLVADGSLSSTATVRVEVTASALALTSTATLSVVPGTSIALQVAGVDAFDNRDVDFLLSTSATVVPASAGLELAATCVAAQNSCVVALRRVLLDNSYAQVEFISGALRGLWLPLVDVRADRLSLAWVDGVVSPSTTPAVLVVTGADAFGNIDSGYILDPAVVLELRASTTGALAYAPASVLVGVVSQYSVRVTQAPDGAALRFLLRDHSAGIAGETTARVTVTAQRLRVLGPSTPSVLALGDAFDVTVLGEDLLGNLDIDYRLSTATEVVASEGALTVLSSTASGLSLSLASLLGRRMVTLTVSDGALTGAAVLEVQGAQPDALRLSPTTTTVVVGATFTLTVQVIDADGEALTGTSVQLGAAQLRLSGGGALATVERVASGADALVLRLLGALDNSAVVLTVAADGLSGTSSLTASVVATALRLSGPGAGARGHRLHLGGARRGRRGQCG